MAFEILSSHSFAEVPALWIALGLDHPVFMPQAPVRGRNSLAARRVSWRARHKCTQASCSCSGQPSTACHAWGEPFSLARGMFGTAAVHWQCQLLQTCTHKGRDGRWITWHRLETIKEGQLFLQNQDQEHCAGSFTSCTGVHDYSWFRRHSGHPFFLPARGSHKVSQRSAYLPLDPVGFGFFFLHCWKQCLSHTAELQFLGS